MYNNLKKKTFYSNTVHTVILDDLNSFGGKPPVNAIRFKNTIPSHFG